MFVRETLCTFNPLLQNAIGVESQQLLDSQTPEKDLAHVRLQMSVMQYRNIHIALVKE
jgi:hypothetical protein